MGNRDIPVYPTFLAALMAFSVLLTAPGLDAQQVAIFDYDDRLGLKHTVAQYIETQLKQVDPGIRIKQYTGRGDEVHSIDVMRSLDLEGHDLIITITSDALILAKHLLNLTPVLYTNANNPLSLGFKTIGPNGGNISGASYYVPIERQIALFKKIHPKMASVGFIFDRHNKSRKVELPEARDACNRAGLRHEIEIIETTADLRPSVQRLLDHGVDAVIATSSDKVYTNIDFFLDQCDAAGVPIFSFNRTGVRQGAVAALASDYYRMVDELLIPMALEVLKEEISPGDMPAAFLTDNIIYLNTRQIEKMGLTIPTGLIQEAAFVD